LAVVVVVLLGVEDVAVVVTELPLPAVVEEFPEVREALLAVVETPDLVVDAWFWVVLVWLWFEGDGSK
jgi:hypothetical protein